MCFFSTPDRLLHTPLPQTRQGTETSYRTLYKLPEGLPHHYRTLDKAPHPRQATAPHPRKNYRTLYKLPAFFVEPRRESRNEINVTSDCVFDFATLKTYSSQPQTCTVKVKARTCTHGGNQDSTSKFEQATLIEILLSDPPSSSTSPSPSSSASAFATQAPVTAAATEVVITN